MSKKIFKNAFSVLAAGCVSCGARHNLYRRRKHIRYAAVLLAAVLGTSSVYISQYHFGYGEKAELYFVHKVEAAEKNVRIKLEADQVDYQGKTLLKIVVKLDTDHVLLQAYSLYLDYDSTALKPIAIYQENGQYDSAYYSYNRDSQPIVNYMDEKVNAQFVSLSDPVQEKGSILFIAYFEKMPDVSPEQINAQVSVSERSRFTGSAKDGTNVTYPIAENSVLSVYADLKQLSEGSSNKQNGQTNITQGQIQNQPEQTDQKPQGTSSIGSQTQDQTQNPEENVEDTKDIENAEDMENTKNTEKAGDIGNTKDIKNITNTPDTKNTIKKQHRKKEVLNKKKAVLRCGNSIKLKVRNTEKKVRWSSSNKKVAKVNQKGKVTAKRKGTAVIRAKLKNGTVLKCKVKVKK